MSTASCAGELSGDPDKDALKDWIETSNVIPPADDSDVRLEVFSPHRGKGVFAWYKEIAGAPPCSRALSHCRLHHHLRLHRHLDRARERPYVDELTTGSGQWCGPSNGAMERLS